LVLLPEVVAWGGLYARVERARILPILLVIWPIPLSLLFRRQAAPRVKCPVPGKNLTARIDGCLMVLAMSEM